MAGPQVAGGTRGGFASHGDVNPPTSFATRRRRRDPPPYPAAPDLRGAVQRGAAMSSIAASRPWAMRQLIVNTFLTLDGVMQAPGGPEEDPSGGFEHGGWSFGYWDEQMQEAMG